MHVTAWYKQKEGRIVHDIGGALNCYQISSNVFFINKVLLGAHISEHAYLFFNS